jgi:SAM-dependent methyltransferase
MKFEKEYFVDSSYSNYKDYRQKKYKQTVNDLIKSVPINLQDKILDYGAATGAVIYEFIQYGVNNVVGTDISYWAIESGRKLYGLSNNNLQHHNRQLLEDNFDLVLFLDVLEHATLEEIDKILSLLKSNKIVVRLPVSKKEGEDFVLDVSKNDKTHIQIHDKDWWCSIFDRFGFKTFTVLDESSIYESEGVFSRILSR